jgi:hypothetical protein
MSLLQLAAQIRLSTDDRFIADFTMLISMDAHIKKNKVNTYTASMFTKTIHSLDDLGSLDRHKLMSLTTSSHT